jgi:hypothetical protein|tara:strand:+ start:69 stop:950 length:882 start_codon:yes stop_codon:yes gene_type:complete
MISKLKYFSDNGFVKLDNLLDHERCAELYHNLKNNRNWGMNLFQSEKEFLDEFKDKPFKKINPGKGIQNLIDEYNMDFVEQNDSVIQVLNKVLGFNYEIMLSKFVVAVPEKWMPDYVKKRKVKLESNFNQYMKKEYRNVTYFRGIDYHMDSIDWENQDNQFITMYIYLNKVDKFMSPLNIIKKSHIHGHSSFPHFIKDHPTEKYLEYSPDNKNFNKFDKHMLLGEAGSVFLWTGNTLHGSAPSLSEKENFRISLRYLIKKNKNSEGLLDKIVKQKTVGSTRAEIPGYKEILTK